MTHLPKRGLRAALALFAGVLVVAIAWGGNLDTQSSEYMESAMLGAGAIYATARGINAVVSVLQGTELDAFLVTFSVGELLDPVNDLIERFSGVMLVALASLGMQRLLLEIATHSLFNAALTLAGAGTVIAAVWGDRDHYQTWLKLFLVALILRFGLALTVLMSTAVDTFFLQEREQANHQSMIAFYNTTSAASAAIETGETLAEDLEAARVALAATTSALADARTSLQSASAELQRQQQLLATLDARPIWQRWLTPEADNVKAQQEVVRTTGRRAANLEQSVAELEASAAVQAENVQCLEKRSRGEACSMLEGMVNKAGDVLASANPARQASYIRNKIERIAGQMDEFASSVVYLLASMLLKSIVFPLLFLLIIYRLSKGALQHVL